MGFRVRFLWFAAVCCCHIRPFCYVYASSFPGLNRRLQRFLSHGSEELPAAVVRRSFIEYFEERHGHVFVPSSPVHPQSDRTVSFVNAGVTQFKPIVLSEEEPPWPRVVNSQKCIRIRGKHNDLALVGRDGSHHTFFEMLGNWSFGDYFKKEACSMAWDLLTNVYKIPKDRLYITYFAGDERMGLAADEETREIWLELGVDPSRVLPFPAKDNFWEMASVGPCGPCTEIHYDLVGEGRDASSLVNSSPEVVEVWNLVFMQHNRSGSGDLEVLLRQVVDTGMGFERLVAILNGKTSNYETDVFRRLFTAIEKFTGHSGYTGKYGKGSRSDIAYRIIADHARMLTVGFADRLIPQIHNRLRAVFRKAMSETKMVFGVQFGLLKELSNYVAEDLSPVYPEIGERLKLVHFIFDKEEALLLAREQEAEKSWQNLLKDPTFRRISSVDVEERSALISGYNYLKSEVLSKKLTGISGQVAFKLFDTYGIPLAKTKLIGQRLGLAVNVDEFNKLDQDLRTVDKEALDAVSEENRMREKEFRDQVRGTTPTSLCVNDAEVTATVDSIIVGKDFVDSVTVGDFEPKTAVGVFLDRTNIYPRTTHVRSEKGEFLLDGFDTPIHVTSVKPIRNRIVHYLDFDKTDSSVKITKNATGRLRVDNATREMIARSNTCLQLLRVLLGQRLTVFHEVGSYCDVDAFYLDIVQYGEDLTVADIFSLEKEMTSAIEDGWSVSQRDVPWSEVTKMRDLVTRPGQNFIQSSTPVVTLSSGSKTWNLACSGPVTSCLSSVGDCIITSFGRGQHYKVKRIFCITGEKADVGRSATKEFVKVWDDVQDFNTAKFDDAKQMAEVMQNLKNFLDKMFEYRFLPHYVREPIRSQATVKFQYMKKILDKDVGEAKKLLRKMSK